ncbi:MAG: hypothetical protein R3F62_28010 [Planctomycetota bacterium]
MRGDVDLIFEHPSGGRLYQSGFQAVPDDLTTLGVSLLVVATEKYQRHPSHENVVLTLFPDEEGLPNWRWAQIERMVVPAVATMVAALEAGEGVLAVCRAGINRSSLLTGLALNAVSGLRPQQVVELIRARHDPGCLRNEDFESVVLYGF